MREIPGNIVWSHVPDCRDEAYKLKQPRPDVLRPVETASVVSSETTEAAEVLNEVETLRLAQALGEVAGRETIE